MSLWLVIIYRVGRCLHGMRTGVAELVASPAPRSSHSERPVVSASPTRGSRSTRSRARPSLALMIYQRQQRVFLSVLGWTRMVPLAATAPKASPTGRGVRLSAGGLARN